MFACFKRTQKSVSTDLEEMRKRNNESIQELLEKNQMLERKRDLRNPKKVMKDELELAKECERQIKKLNLEVEKYNAKEEKLMDLERKRDEVFCTLERTNGQIIEEPVLKSFLSGAKEHEKILKRLNTRLTNHVNILTDQRSYQGKVLDKYTKSADDYKNLMKIQENLITEIMDKLEIFNLAALKDKTMAEEENYVHLDKIYDSLSQKLESLRKQLVDVPIMRYHYKCARKECQRLTQLNPKLEKLVQDLTDELSYKTALERDYKEAKDLLKELEETEQNYLDQIEELKSMVKPGIKSKKKDKDKMAKRLTSLVLKLNNVKKEYISFQIDIENIVGNIHSLNVDNTEDGIRPADEQKFTGQHSNLAGGRKQISLNSIVSDGECVPSNPMHFLVSEDEARDKKLEDRSSEGPTTEDYLAGLNNITVKESDPQDRQRLRENEKQVNISESEDETSDKESEDTTSEDTESENELTKSYDTTINESFPQALQGQRENEKQEKISELEDETREETLENTTSEDDLAGLNNITVEESDPQDRQSLRENEKQVDISESKDETSDKESEDSTSEDTKSENELTKSYNTTINESFPQALQGQRENEKQEKISELEDETSSETLENTTSEDDLAGLNKITVKVSDPQDRQRLRENEKQVDISESEDDLEEGCKRYNESIQELLERNQRVQRECERQIKKLNLEIEKYNTKEEKEDFYQQDFSKSVDKIHDKELEDRTLEDTRCEDDLTDSHNTTVKSQTLQTSKGRKKKGNRNKKGNKKKKGNRRT